MKIITSLSLITTIALMSSCGNNSSKSTVTTTDSTVSANNLLLQPSTLPFQVADFAHIKSGDFKAAFDAGIKQQQGELQAIANSKDSATFENTLVALEKSGQTLRRVNGIFNLLSSANTDPILQKLGEDVAPRLASLNDELYLNTALYNKVKSIYDRRAMLKLEAESNRLVEFYYQHFLMAGAALPDSAKEKLKALNKEDAGLSAKFTNQLLAAAKAGALVATDKAELAGLSDGEIDAAAQDAKNSKLDGKWKIPLQNTTQQPALKSLTVRATRQKLFNASWTRAEKNDSNDTRATISRQAQVRAEKARLLGKANFAAVTLQDQMSKNPEAVLAFLGKLVPAATANAANEAKELQALIDKQKGGFQLEASDWDFYSEQLRKEKYNLDENEIKPYFELWNVLQNGVMYAATQLYGITFKERKDLPVYNSDVHVFEVFDKDGTSMALAYFDYFKRDNKTGGAWMDNMVGQSKLLGTKPVIYNICNFTKPAAGQPALISFSDATTMFHEFGHGLHGLFASQQYPSLSGTATARDFVEFPSQFNEHWATEPNVFKHYATHYKTGAVMPQDLVDKLKKAATFNQGYALTEILAAASLDMMWHTLAPDMPLQDVDKFETEALKRTHLDMAQVPTRYRSSYFLHIWSNGYSAGYYAYLWSEMLDDDAWAWFQEHGGLNRENGQRFRDMVLSRGNTMDLGQMFTDFRGHAPDIKPMLVNRGLAK